MIIHKRGRPNMACKRTCIEFGVFARVDERAGIARLIPVLLQVTTSSAVDPAAVGAGADAFKLITFNGRILNCGHRHCSRKEQLVFWKPNEV